MNIARSAYENENYENLIGLSKFPWILIYKPTVFEQPTQRLISINPSIVAKPKGSYMHWEINHYCAAGYLHYRGELHGCGLAAP